MSLGFGRKKTGGGWGAGCPRRNTGKDSGDKGSIETCYRQVIRNLTGILGSPGETLGASERRKDNARFPAKAAENQEVLNFASDSKLQGRFEVRDR